MKPRNRWGYFPTVRDTRSISLTAKGWWYTDNDRKRNRPAAFRNRLLSTRLRKVSGEGVTA